MADAGVAALYVPGTTRVHVLPAQVKVAGAIGLVFAVALTPREAFWAYGLFAATIAVVAASAGLRPSLIARRMAVEVPFVAFALMLPLVGQGERTEVLRLSLSVSGLWAAWTILAKATLGVAVSVVLASTTPATQIIGGLEALRVPRPFTAIMGFMLRYADVLTEKIGAQRQAMASRGYDPRWFFQAKPLAISAGTLFVRSYERGERIQRAMIARGFAGTMPASRQQPATRSDWLIALTPAGAAFAVALASWRLL
ncbi:MAG: cobalt ECF transporter T component CbiQ [Acidimicrobiia bacterium]|nr:cobalt ECF transporter T component CbiQ [Acidimicrobiia bacterium]